MLKKAIAALVALALVACEAAPAQQIPPAINDLAVWQGQIQVCLRDVPGTACDLYASTNTFATREICNRTMGNLAQQFQNENPQLRVAWRCVALPLA